MCTINKSVHTKKSGNLFNDPRIYLPKASAKVRCDTISILKQSKAGLGSVFVHLTWLGNGLVWFGWFYGISTFIGYLTPNSFLWK